MASYRWLFARAILPFVLLFAPTMMAQESPPITDISSIISMDDLRLPTWGDATLEPDIKDEDYFAFDTKNFDDSLVVVWYSLWTMLRQNETQWKELGEWKLFAHDWYNTKNFECALSMAECSGDRRLEGLQAIYPGLENRPLVRRIYFVSMMYMIFHNYANLIQTSFDRVKTNLVPMVPELVAGFTQQGNAHADRLCSIVKTVGEALIGLAIALTSTAVTVALAPVLLEAAELVQLVELGAKLGLHTALVIGQPALAVAVKEGMRKNVATGIPGFLYRLSQKLKPLQWSSKGVKFSYNWWGTIQSLPQMYYTQVTSVVQAAREEYGALDVEGGYGNGGWGRLCSQFEGDFASRNALNMDKLQIWIPGQFELIRSRIQRLYKEIYEGSIPFPGGPSLMAFMMSASPWTGEDSFLSDLRDTGKWQYNLERNFVKGIISKLLAKSYNYMVCTHDPKARAMCDAADKYSKPSSEWDERMTTLSKSRFCPLPDTDPNMICQVEKWYFAVTSQHDRAMNGLDSFEGFQLNRFKFKRKELFKESFDNYIRCGNNCTNLDWHKGPFSRDMTFAGIFHMPTCKSDNLRLMDFTQFWGWKAHPGKSWNGYQTGEWTTWNFPAVCGDHHASETQGFLEAMNAGIHSDVYAHHYYYRSTDQLWKDRIPRQLEAMGLQPYDHFVAMCGAGIYLPGRLFVGQSNRRVPRSPQQGIHYRCKDVSEATAMMNQYEANKWFCVDSYIGKDIQDDTRAGRYHLPELPERRLLNYRQRCRKWRRRYLKPVDKEVIITKEKSEEKPNGTEIVITKEKSDGTEITITKDKSDGIEIDISKGKAENEPEGQAEPESDEDAEEKAEDESESEAEDQAEPESDEKAEGKAEDESKNKAEDQAEEDQEEAGKTAEEESSGQQK